MYNPFLANQADPKDWDALDEFDDYEEEDIEIGYCQGCSRYGTLGEVCVRRIDGHMEECGEYL